MRSLAQIGLLLAVAACANAATLERLTLEDMAVKSTSVVVGRLLGSTPLTRGSVIYTQFRFQVKDTWKGSAAGEVVVTVPGGESGALRQTFSGTPKFHAGQDYLLFLWLGKNGLTQVIGLVQGAFELKMNAAGQLMAVRSPISETLLDAVTGEPVEDRGMQVAAEELRALLTKLVNTKTP